jgi:mono/diheme cytochrome c family protein
LVSMKALTIHSLAQLPADHHPRRRIGGLLAVLLLAAAVGIVAPPVCQKAAAQEVLEDPVVFGAWLFKAHCLRCHGDYGEERLAGEFEDDGELRSAFERDRCRIKWGRRSGGKLGRRESQALIRFMRAYEDGDGPPDLPELPPLPTADLPPAPKPAAKKGYSLAAPTDEIDPLLKGLLAINSVANGAWLYTQNCYRCHLDYEKARSGRGFSEETVRKTVTNGKTSTQMTPFSRMLGGKLSNAEISAIVAYIMVFEKLGESPALAQIVTEPPQADPADILPIGLPQFPRIAGNAANGARLYARHCTTCHGMRGEGHVGRPLAKTWLVLRPDLLIKSILKQGVPGSPMPAWTQNAGGPLNAKEIDDVITQVLGLGRETGNSPPEAFKLGQRARK